MHFQFFELKFDFAISCTSEFSFTVCLWLFYQKLCNTFHGMTLDLVGKWNPVNRCSRLCIQTQKESLFVYEELEHNSDVPL